MKIFTPHPGPEFTRVDSSPYPDLRDENRVFLQLLLCVIPVMLVVAVVYQFLASPAALKLRTGVLGRMIAVRRFYADPPQAALNAAPGKLLLGLGDSVTIFSFHTPTVDAELGDNGYSAYNLAQPAKGMCEYIADLSQPLTRNALVISFVNPASTFAANQTELVRRKANMLRLLDYEIDPQPWLDYAARVPDSGVEYLLEPRYVHVLDSRWRIVDHLRLSLRVASPLTSPATRQNTNDLDNIFSKDLKYPTMSLKMGPKRVARDIEVRAKLNPQLVTGGFHPTERSIAAFDYMVDTAANDTQGLVLVLAPLHPLLRERLGPEGMAQYRQLLGGYSRDRVRLLDLSELLGDEDFRDDVHLTESGAVKATEEILRELNLQ